MPRGPSGGSRVIPERTPSQSVACGRLAGCGRNRHGGNTCPPVHGYTQLGVVFPIENENPALLFKGTEMTKPVGRQTVADRTRLIATLIVLVLLTPTHGHGQDRQALVVSDSVSLRTPPTISPRSGSRGTDVTVSAIHLPAITPVQIGIGAIGTGFEVLEQLMTSPEGEITHTVQVPQWVTMDRSHVFIVFDIYFRPLSMSDPFHVTDRNGLMSRSGRISRRDARCTTLLGDDDQLYALEGDVRGLRTDDEVVIEGALAAESGCDQGTAVDVVRIRRP